MEHDAITRLGESESSYEFEDWVEMCEENVRRCIRCCRGLSHGLVLLCRRILYRTGKCFTVYSYWNFAVN